MYLENPRPLPEDEIYDGTPEPTESLTEDTPPLYNFGNPIDGLALPEVGTISSTDSVESLDLSSTSTTTGTLRTTCDDVAIFASSTNFESNFSETGAALLEAGVGNDTFIIDHDYDHSLTVGFGEGDVVVIDLPLAYGGGYSFMELPTAEEINDLVARGVTVVFNGDITSDPSNEVTWFNEVLTNTLGTDIQLIDNMLTSDDNYNWAGYPRLYDAETNTSVEATVLASAEVENGQALYTDAEGDVVAAVDTERGIVVFGDSNYLNVDVTWDYLGYGDPPEGQIDMIKDAWGCENAPVLDKQVFLPLLLRTP